MSKKSDCFETGLIAGIIGGIVAGILFAPQDGKKSRKKLVDAVENFNEKHEDDIENAKKQICDSYDLLKYNVERQFRILVNKVRARRLRKAKEREAFDIFSAEIN